MTLSNLLGRIPVHPISGDEIAVVTSISNPTCRTSFNTKEREEEEREVIIHHCHVQSLSETADFSFCSYILGDKNYDEKIFLDSDNRVAQLSL